MKTLGMNIAMSRNIWIAEFGERYNEQDKANETKKRKNA